MKNILPHLTLSMLAVFVVLIILDGYNPTAGYLNSDVSKIFDLLLVGLGAATAVRLIRTDWEKSGKQAGKSAGRQRMKQSGKSKRKKR